MLILLAEITHVFAALIVMGEALNKIYTVCPLAPNLTTRERWIDVLKGVSWVSLAIGAGGAIASPVLWALDIPASDTRPFLHRPPSFAEVATMFGFAVLVIRNRLQYEIK